MVKSKKSKEKMAARNRSKMKDKPASDKVPKNNSGHGNYPILTWAWILIVAVVLITGYWVI